MQHNHLSPAAVKAGLGPIGWHTLRHTHRAWLGDNREALTVWRRDDGIDAEGAWESGEAGDGALMDASGRQRVA